MKRRILICPNCNSSDNTVNWENPWAVEMGSFNTQRKCNNCGYVGQLFTEPDSGESYEVEEGRIPKEFWEDMFKPAMAYLKIEVVLLLIGLILSLIIFFLTL